jgi:predicted O-linked N-acetylglucosamine transferase (SPINDLY family)
MNQLRNHSKIQGIEKYQHFLGLRFQTFKSAFDAFAEIKGKVIVELGTSRSFVPAGVEGSAVNDSKYCDVNNPGKWDWGAGIFTRMCAMHLEAYKPEIHTVDISSDAIEICKVITSDYSHLISYHVMTSEDFLMRYNGKIDFLYMDTGESDEQADKLHLKEAQIALSRKLFSENAIILIDDVNNPGINLSKGRYSIPFLYQNGFQLKFFDYQILLQRNRNTKSMCPEYQFDLANKNFEKGDYSNAIKQYEELLIQRPGNISILTNLSTAYFQMGQIIDSRNILTQLADQSPQNGDIWNNLGKMYRETGQVELSLDCFQKSFQFNHSDVIASNYLFALNYSCQKTPEQIADAHFNWGASKKTMDKQCQVSKHDSIRIGYVSPDFSSHVIAFFIRPILRNHDYSRFKVFCYANVAVTDTVTKDYQKMNIAWRNIYGHSDTSVLAQIQKDNIDILIDLAGHTHNNRLPLFALKPAPVQVTYLGYPNTTGLQTIDYRLTDTIADPPSFQQFYTEKLMYLSPCFLCYEPLNHTPSPERHYSEKITFGSFNNLGKMNAHVVQTWAAILKELPNARLFLKSKVLADDKMQQFVRNTFSKYDIQPDRLDFSGYINHYTTHLEQYHKVDIALDSFPYNGTTTTFESLWMGVPVLTLAGKTHSSRVSKSILTSLGLTDLIASSESDYIAKAIRLASNKSLLNTLRYSLRHLLSHSQLLNAKGFVRQLETVYQKICQTDRNNNK